MKRVQKLHDRNVYKYDLPQTKTRKVPNIRNLHNRKFLRKQIERCTEVK